MRESKPTGRRWARRTGIVAAGLVAVTGLTASGVAATLVHVGEWRAARSVITRTVGAVQAAVQSEMQRYVDANRLVAAGVGALPTITPAGFEAATAPLGALNLHGVSAVAFVVPTATADVASTQAAWRERGVTGLTLRPEGTGEHIFAVLNRPLDGSPRTAGADLSTVEQPVGALNRARATGTTAVSEPYVLIRDRSQPEADQQRAVVFATPVNDVAGRLQGWLITGVRAADLMASLLSPSTYGRFDVSVHSGSALIARLTGDAGATDRPELTGEGDFTVADKRWTLRVEADRATLPGADTVLDRGIAVGGTALTAVVAALVYVLVTARRRLESQVRTATAGVRTAEREARRQAGLLGAVMDSISDGVGVVDEQGRFLLHNPAARTLLGTTVEPDETGEWQAHFGIFRPDTVTPYPLEEMPLIRALQGEKIDHAEMVIRNPGRPDGIHLDVSARPLDPAAGQPGAVAVFHDVTERRAAEHAIRKLNAELEERVAARTAELFARAEQLRAANAELEAFSYSVSHDLRAPLRAVDGFARMLELDHAEHLDGTGRRYVARVRAGAQTMGDLIDGLLAFSRLQRQELSHEEVSVAGLVEEVWDELAPDRAGRVVELTVTDLPPAAGDRRLLRQVVANLLDNALKYTRGRDPARIAIGYEDNAYHVRDNGTGFDSRYADRLFQVFQRLHRAEDYEGTGVGLALASRIIQRHDGRIWAEAATGCGATFFFTLPAASRRQAGPRPTPRPQTEEATDALHADAGAAGRGQPERPGAGAARV